ncbi:MAG: phosphatase PAP2 family protein [Clostridia bacterium]|nr:phosphatase PAP2 family protein [Clostridia bacterium]
MQLLYFFESIRSPIFDALFSAVTHAGEETVFIIVGLLLFWCVSKQKGYFLLCIGLMGTVVNQLLKLIFRVPRPWVRDPAFTIVESARAEATGYSFPSGHTQISVSVYGGIARVFSHRLVRIACVLLCVLVPVSRMYLGVHTPADVFTSVAIALALILVMEPLVARGMDEPRVMRAIFAAMALLSAALLLYAKYYPFPAGSDMENIAHGLSNASKMLGCTAGLALTYEMDSRYIRFDVRAPLFAQAVKLLVGFALLMAIKSGLKSPLQALLGAGMGDFLRYFLMVAFAGCLWPLTFPRIIRLMGKK